MIVLHFQFCLCEFKQINNDSKLETITQIPRAIEGKLILFLAMLHFQLIVLGHSRFHDISLPYIGEDEKPFKCTEEERIGVGDRGIVMKKL